MDKPFTQIGKSQCTLHEAIAINGNEIFPVCHLFSFLSVFGDKQHFNRWFFIFGRLARFFHIGNISVPGECKAAELKPREPKELYDTNVCSSRLRIYLSTSWRWIRRCVPHFYHGQNARQMNARLNFQ